MNVRQCINHSFSRTKKAGDTAPALPSRLVRDRYWGLGTDGVGMDGAEGAEGRLTFRSTDFF